MILVSVLTKNGHAPGTVVQDFALLKQQQNTMLVSVGSDSTLKIWDLKLEKAIESVEKLHKSFEILCVETFGSKIVTGGSDNRINIYNADTGESNVNFHAQDAVVRCLCPLREGEYKDHFISGDTYIYLWSPEGKKVREFKRLPNNLVKVVVPPEQDVLVACAVQAGTNSIHIWNLGTGELIREMTGKHSRTITDLYLTTYLNQRILVSCGQGFQLDVYLNCWNIDTGKFLGGDLSSTTRKIAIKNNLVFAGGVDIGVLDMIALVKSVGEEQRVKDTVGIFHERPLTGLNFGMCDNKPYILSTGMDNKAFLLNYDIKKSKTIIELKDATNDMCIMNNVCFIASGSWKNKDNSINAYDASSGEHLKTLTVEKMTPFNCLCPIPSANLIASAGNDKMIKLWDTNTYELVRSMKGHAGFITDLALIHDEIVSCSGDISVRVWNINSGEERMCLKGHKQWISCVDTIPKLNIIVSGSWDSTVRVWSLENGECIGILKGHTLKITAMAILDQKVVTASHDKSVRLWNIDSMEQEFIYSTPFAVTGIVPTHESDVVAIGCENRVVSKLRILSS